MIALLMQTASNYVFKNNLELVLGHIQFNVCSLELNHPIVLSNLWPSLPYTLLHVTFNQKFGPLWSMVISDMHPVPFLQTQ